MTDHFRDVTKKAGNPLEAPRVVICAGPGRWLCTVGYGHLCGDAPNPERTGGGR